MPVAEKGLWGKGRQPLSPPQHTIAAELDERFGWSHVVDTLTRMRAPMVTDERFWSVIDQGRAGGSASVSPERLSEILNRLSDDEILHCCQMFDVKICDLNKVRRWSARDV